MEKQKNSPILRFPEFKGEWEKKKLGEILKIGSGKDYKHLDEGDIPVFGTGGLMTKVNSFLYDGETVCIGRKGTIDKPMYFNGKIWTVDTLFYTHSFNNSEPKFVFNLFQRVNWKQHNEAGGVPSLSKSTIEQIYLYLPTLPEQKRIASFFTVLDKKIAELKQKKNLLEQYKNGVMQKLFCRNHGLDGFTDDTDENDIQKSVKSFNPKNLRFRQDNGKEFPNWEMKKLGEVFIKNSNKNKGQKYSLVQSVSNKYGFINQDEMFEDRRVASKDTSNYYVIEKGHFAYNPSRIDVGSLAYKFDDEISTISPLYISFRAKKENLNDDYLLNWFNTEQFIKQMNSSFEGSVRNTLSYESLVKMVISIPCLEEQTKIANFLTAIDVKINRTENQIQQTQQFKKGLLQKMFV